MAFALRRGCNAARANFDSWADDGGYGRSYCCWDMGDCVDILATTSAGNTRDWEKNLTCVTTLAPHKFDIFIHTSSCAFLNEVISNYHECDTVTICGKR